MAEATCPNHADEPGSSARIHGPARPLDLRTSTAKIGAVAPWLDIPDAYLRHWIRAHRWKTLAFVPGHCPGLFPAPGEQHTLPGLASCSPRRQEACLWAGLPT